MAKQKFKHLGNKRREAGRRPPKYHFLIVTNGEVTERKYFRDYGNDLSKKGAVVWIEEPSFQNGNPSAVVKKAKELSTSSRYCFCEEIWAVFDKDDFPDFKDAVSSGQSGKIKIGYSNPCFELWLLLHFQDVSSDMTTKTVIDKVESHFKKSGSKYEKNGKIFDFVTTKGSEKEACRRAENLEKTFEPWKNPPSTSIHKLIEQINKKCKTEEV